MESTWLIWARRQAARDALLAPTPGRLRKTWNCSKCQATGGDCKTSASVGGTECSIPALALQGYRSWQCKTLSLLKLMPASHAHLRYPTHKLKPSTTDLPNHCRLTPRTKQW